jgi:hypothetical protein
MKMYLKLMLNKLKIMGNSTFIYTHWAYSSKKLPIYMWPMFTHVRPCVAYVHPCVNYD